MTENCKILEYGSQEKDNKKEEDALTVLRQWDGVADADSTGAALAKETYKNAKVRLFPDEGPMVQELLNGKATALLATAPQPAQLAAKYPDTLILLDENLVQQPICMGVPKGDPDTMAYLNNWITYVRNNGFIKKKVDYWWKSLEWEALLQ